jgi:hypothetical protein
MINAPNTAYQSLNMRVLLTLDHYVRCFRYGRLEATLHERGMGHYAESHEGGRSLIADGMELKKFS